MIDILQEQWQWMIGMLVGAFVTVLAARVYYQKASKELLEEASELRRMNKLILRGLEEAEIVQLNKSCDGTIRGLKIPVSATLWATGSLEAKSTENAGSHGENLKRRSS